MKFKIKRKIKKPDTLFSGFYLKLSIKFFVLWNLPKEAFP